MAPKNIDDFRNRPQRLLGRLDLDTRTAGRAVIVKAVASGDIAFDSSGIDIGTGDVTFTLTDTAVVPGSYNAFTVDRKGRIVKAWVAASPGYGNGLPIQNQHSSAQAASFWIGGAGTINGHLSVGSFVSGTPIPSASGGTGVSATSPHFVFVGPATGTAAGNPGFRLLQPSDLPQIPMEKLEVGYASATVAGLVKVGAGLAISGDGVLTTAGNYVTLDTDQTITGLKAFSAGIALSDTTAPSITTNRLYSVASVLHWNGVPVGAAAKNLRVIEITNPSVGDNVAVAYATAASEITTARAVLVGSTGGSVTLTLYKSTFRNSGDAGTACCAGTVISSYTTANTIAVTVPALAAGEFLYVVVSAVTTTPPVQVNLFLEIKEIP